VDVLPAYLVATPVLERLDGEGRGAVLGAGATAAWVDLDGFVVAVTTREVPLLPNAVALAAASGALTRSGVAAGSAARLSPGRVDLGHLRITWDPATPPSWDPTVPYPPDGTTPEGVAGRGAALLRALGAHLPEAAGGPVDDREHASPRSARLPLRGPEQPGAALPIAQLPGAALPGAALPPAEQPGAALPPAEWPGAALPRAEQPGAALPCPQQPEAPLPRALVRELARVGLAVAADPDGAAGLTLLLRAVGERDPVPAAAGARELLGRGPGLTPEGDDLVAAVAGTLAVLGPATGLDGPEREALLAALAPLPGRTTALSATLLALAAARRLAEPAGRLLYLGPAGAAGWPGALSRLERLGHGSGRAYAAGIAAAAVLLAAVAPARSGRRRPGAVDGGGTVPARSATLPHRGAWTPTRRDGGRPGRRRNSDRNRRPGQRPNQ
jgi:uncharacterized protein DUF2877